MNQGITIIIDGEDGRVLPDSVGNILHAVFGILRSMDESSWAVRSERIRWRVSDAKLVNPLTITALAEEKYDQHYGGSLDLGIQFVERLQEIDNEKRPNSFSDKDLKLVKLLGIEAKKSRSLTISGFEGEKARTFNVNRTFLSKTNRIIRGPKRIRDEYGSLDGTLIQLSNDPLKDDGTAKLRDRLRGVEIICHAEPDKASEMAKYLNRHTRIVVYGTITYENEIPKSIQVEDYATLPEDGELPTLEDLHAMNLRLPGGVDVEQYLDDLRGDE